VNASPLLQNDGMTGPGRRWEARRIRWTLDRAGGTWSSGRLADSALPMVLKRVFRANAGRPGTARTVGKASGQSLRRRPERPEVGERFGGKHTCEIDRHLNGSNQDRNGKAVHEQGFVLYPARCVGGTFIPSSSLAIVVGVPEFQALSKNRQQVGKYIGEPSHEWNQTD